MSLCMNLWPLAIKTMPVSHMYSFSQGHLKLFKLIDSASTDFLAVFRIMAQQNLDRDHKN